MEDVVKQSFSMNLSFMRIFGLYFTEKYEHVLKSYVINIFLVVFVPILGYLNLILSEDLEKQQINYNISYLVEGTGIMIKVLSFICNGVRIRKFVNFLNSPIFKTNKKKQKLILEECIHTCRRNTKIFIYTLTGAMVSFAVKPLILEGRRLPVDIWLPYKLSEIPNFPYYFLYVFLVLESLYNALAGVAITDPLIGGLAAHATSQLKILKDNLQYLSEYAEEIINNNNKKETEKHKIIYDNIRNCVDHHNAILNFTKEYETCFSLSIFSQVAASTLVVCFACLQDVQSLGQYSVVVLAQVYFYCYYGSALFEESNTLSDAIYMGKWYEYDERCKNALIIMIERSKKPIIITSGKILELSLPTFTLILKRSYSLFAVMKNYQ